MTNHNDPPMDYLLKMEEDDLLVEIMRARSEGPLLYSPGDLVIKARAYLKEVRPTLRKLICPYKDLAKLPEFDLASKLVSMLLGSFPLLLANVIAAYLAKKGIKYLCEERE